MLISLSANNSLALSSSFLPSFLPSFLLSFFFSFLLSFSFLPSFLLPRSFLLLFLLPSSRFLLSSVFLSSAFFLLPASFFLFHPFFPFLLPGLISHHLNYFVFDNLQGGGGGPTPFLYMATRFLPNVHVQKCTKMYKYVFSCLEVLWIDLLAVANLQ